jgi:hypothetical protein
MWQLYLRVGVCSPPACAEGFGEEMRKRSRTNLTKVAHYAWQAFVVQVWLWCGHARTWRFKAELIGSIVVTCGRPAAFVINGCHHNHTPCVVVSSITNGYFIMKNASELTQTITAESDEGEIDIGQ